MRIPKEILDVAFKIGFNYSKQSYNEKAMVTLPCSIKLKNGQTFEQAELILIENLYKESDYTFFQIEDVESISESKYALSADLRNASINTPEYRNDFPFFIETKYGKTLGYNAINTVNFTYKDDVLGQDIMNVVDFNQAQSNGFDFIKDHSKLSVQILCGYDAELIEKIKTEYNNIYSK
jgi:hypothetical protein